MTFSSSRFGAIDYSNDDVVTFEDGLLGFPDCHCYLILEHKAGSPFRWLQSLDAPELAFLITDPSTFISGFAPALASDWANALKLDDQTPRLVYTIVTIPSGRPDAMTINLAGPIVINAELRIAKQLVIEEEGYGVRHPIFGAETLSEPIRVAA